MDEHIEKIMAGFLEESQSEEDKKQMAAALRTGELEEEKVTKLKTFYDLMATAPEPEPRPELRSKFYQMLAQEKQKEARKFKLNFQPQPWLAKLLEFLPIGKLAYSGLLLGLGVAFGFWFNQRQNPEKAELAALTTEMQQMKKMVLLTLLEKPSATERLKAVNLTNDMETADRKVIVALLQTLNQDPSVNVRLAAIEALYQHADNPEARQGLVQSINQQDSPLVQLALADIMVAMQEKDAVKQLRKLLQKENLNEAVKVKVKQSIRVLI